MDVVLKLIAGGLFVIAGFLVGWSLGIIFSSMKEDRFDVWDDD
jgi:hypothetical protein